MCSFDRRGAVADGQSRDRAGSQDYCSLLSIDIVIYHRALCYHYGNQDCVLLFTAALMQTDNLVTMRGAKIVVRFFRYCRCTNNKIDYTLYWVRANEPKERYDTTYTFTRTVVIELQLLN